MVKKGNFAIFEGSSISKTGEATPTKIGVHAFDINPYLHEFFELILIYSPWSEREFWPFLKVGLSSK